jgi:uncharacterized cupin superfamily protein/transcriptional regulator with XRE-family HTH domain
VSSLFITTEEERASVVRAGDRALTQFGNLPAPSYMLTPFEWRSSVVPEIEAMWMDVPGGTTVCEEGSSFLYDEYIYIVDGELEYRHGDEAVRARKSDGIFIPRRTAHHILNTGKKPAKIIWIGKARSADGRTMADAHTGQGDKEDRTLNKLPQLKLIGERIRSLREGRGISIRKFATQIGMTAAYISKVERNLLEPSIHVLRKVADALDIEIIYLFADAFPADVLISNADDTSRAFRIPESKVRFAAMVPSYLSDGGKPDLLIVRASLGAGDTDTDGFVVHDYVEFVIVLSGCVEYITDTDTYKLAAGDSLYLARNVPHAIRNAGRVDCEMLTTLGNLGRRMKVQRDE